MYRYPDGRLWTTGAIRRGRADGFAPRLPRNGNNHTNNGAGDSHGFAATDAGAPVPGRDPDEFTGDAHLYAYSYVDGNPHPLPHDNAVSHA